MPDMGVPHEPRGGTPRDWREALSAMPLETPDGDGWPRLAACLPMTGADGAGADGPRTDSAGTRVERAMSRRGRGMGWLAMAAVLAVASVVPFRLMQGDAPVRPPSLPAGASSGTPALAVPSHSGPASTVAGTAPAATGREPIAGDDRGIDIAVPDPQPMASTMAPTRRQPRAMRAPSPDDASTAVAATDTATDATTPTGEAFDRLYAESARLEAMVALARDDGMSSATAAAMTAELDARIGHIDDSLSRPGLLPDERLDLWRARVGVLRDLASLETTQRMLYAQGTNYDAALVRVD